MKWKIVAVITFCAGLIYVAGVQPAHTLNKWQAVLANSTPFLLLLVVWIFLMARKTGGGSGLDSWLRR